MKKLAVSLFAALLFAAFAIPAAAAPSPAREEATVIESVEELPDAGDPGSPDFIIIQEEGTPLDDAPLYVKVEDEDGNWTYIPEDEVPMAEAVETVGTAVVAEDAAGSSGGGVGTGAVVAIAAGVGVIGFAVAYGVSSRKKG